MAKYRCDGCGRDDFRTPTGLASHRRAKHPPQVDGPILTAVDRAVEAASHLTPMDAAAVAVLRTLARTIDGMADRDDDAPFDNVTIPTFFKYATELGLTPKGRSALDPQGGPRSASKLDQLRQAGKLTAIQGGKTS